jgi:phage nucleotide-binding protein
MTLSDLVGNQEEPILTTRTLGGLPIEPVSDVQDYINLLVYGYAGVGKTVLAGSACVVEEMSPVLLIDVEGGSLSLEKDYSDIDVVRVTSWNDLFKIYMALAKGDTGYKTVILDSLSEMQKLSMSDIMKDLLKEKPDVDPDVPGLKQYMKNTEQMRRFVRAFRNLPMNVIFTALAVDQKIGSGDSQTTIKKVGLTDKLSSEIAGFVDVVLYMYIRIIGNSTKRLLLSQATNDVTAKDRTGRLPIVFEDPTMAKLYPIMRNKEGASNG